MQKCEVFFMKLMIDGRAVEAMPGQSLLELVKAVGLDCEGLAEKPLAAKIAGEVFTLNYIPVRVTDAQVEQPSMRRAMAASGGVVRLLRYRDDLVRRHTSAPPSLPSSWPCASCGPTR